MFDTIIHLGLCFIILVPVLDEARIEQIWTMMDNEGFKLLPLQDVIEMKERNLYLHECYCCVGLHYGPFCEHCLQDNLSTGIILDFPALRKPTLLPRKSTGGTGGGNLKHFQKEHHFEIRPLPSTSSTSSSSTSTNAGSRNRPGRPSSTSGHTSHNKRRRVR